MAKPTVDSVTDLEIKGQIPSQSVSVETDVTQAAGKGLADHVRDAFSGALDRVELSASTDAAIGKAIAEARRQQRLAAARPNGAAAQAHRLKAAQAYTRAVALKHLPAAMRTIDPGKIPPFDAVPPRVFLPPVIDLPLGEVIPGELNSRLAAAADKAGLWRYEHLVEIARKAAIDAVAYEGQLTQVLQLALSKGVAAQEVLAPALLDAVDKIEDSIADVIELASDDQVKSLLGTAADLALQQVMLALVLAWFAEHDVVEFWIGLFGAIVKDIAGFDTDLGHTGDYLNHAFSLVDGLADAVSRIEADLEHTLDGLLQPLRDSVAGMVSASNNALSELFNSFDLPLTAAAPPIPGTPDLLDVNPLATIEGELAAAVDRLRDELLQQLKHRLDTDVAGLFRDVMLGFVVVPILAVLAIGIATGPIGAAALAAVVLIAAEELVHLVLTWLSGPLLGVLDGLRKRALAALDPLRDVVASTAGLVTAHNPAHTLEVVTAQLRELKDLLPQAFLDDVANLLEAARDAVLDSATDLALAAEQALGRENATAFDVVATAYGGSLSTAPQLPGGDTSRLYASAKLLGDLDRLDHARTEMHDGRETELTHRISLRSLLGDAGFAALLTRGEVVIPLSADNQLRSSYPGIYRVLIKEIRPSIALVLPAGATDVAGVSVPLMLTHLGENRARVKRDGNRLAPPVEGDRRLHESVESTAVVPAILAAAERALYGSVHRVVVDIKTGWHHHHFGGWLGGLFGDLFEQIEQAIAEGHVPAIAFLAAYHDALWAEIRQVCEQQTGSAMDPAAICSPTDTAFAVLATQFSAASFDVLHLDVTDPAWDSPGNTALGYINTHSPGMGSFLQTVHLRVIDEIVRPAARTEYVRAQHALDAHIAKWGAARYETDPNAAVAALGFTTLVRDDAEETAVFSLLADDSPTTLLPLTGQAIGIAPPAATLLRYSSFENRGYDGALRLTLPAVARAIDAGVVASTPTDLGWLAEGRTGAATATVQDLILDVVVRACYDTDLAATTEATRDHQNMPTPLPTGSGTRQRILLSLRDIATRGAVPANASDLTSILPATLTDLAIGIGGGSLLSPELADLLPVLGGTVAPDRMRVVGLGAAVIPSAAAAQANPPRFVDIEIPAAALLAGLRPIGGAQTTTGLASLAARNLVSTAAHPHEASDTDGLPLADLLSAAGHELLRVPGLRERAGDVYDVLLSVTVEVDAAALPNPVGLSAVDGPMVVSSSPVAGANGTVLHLTGQRLSGSVTRVALLTPGATWDGVATTVAGGMVFTPPASSVTPTAVNVNLTGLTAGTTYTVVLSVDGRTTTAPTTFTCLASTTPSLDSASFAAGQLTLVGIGLGTATTVSVISNGVTVLTRTAGIGFTPELIDAATNQWRIVISALLPPGAYTAQVTLATPPPVSRTFTV